MIRSYDTGRRNFRPLLPGFHRFEPKMPDGMRHLASSEPSPFRGLEATIRVMRSVSFLTVCFLVLITGLAEYSWNPARSDHGTWPPPWLKLVRRQVGSWCVSSPGKTWVVAVSGGSDSVGLLRVLHGLAPEFGLTLSVAHLDHGVRGDAAREDAAFVEELARSLGLIGRSGSVAADSGWAL